MPFPMTHLYIAQKIAESFPRLAADYPQFFLGTLAPDAVHFREGFTGDDKKKSHLVVGDEKWGQVTNDTEWIDSVLSFLQARKKSENRDFVYGYVIHILADVYNNIHVWSPFLEKHPAEWGKTGYESLYHTESARIDLKLSQDFAHKAEVWKWLEESSCFDFEGLVSAEEMKRGAENILYKQYSNLPVIDTSAHTLFTYEKAVAFIDGAAQFVMETLAL